MKKYSVGFAFDRPEDLAYGDLSTSVGLILKNKPEWQAGHLNGIGGSIEEGETAHQAMVREFKEEAGLFVPNWEPVTVLGNDYFSLSVFKSFNVPLHEMRSTSDEGDVGAYVVNEIPNNVLFNLHWLIPMALDPQMHPSVLRCI